MRKDSFFLKAVIDWVNEGRAVLGAPPLDDLPKGKRVLAGSCPIATALNVRPDIRYSVCAEYGAFTKVDGSTDQLKMDNPEFITRFINDFDHYKYPEYALAPGQVSE